MRNLSDEGRRRHPNNNLSVDQWERNANGDV